MSSGSGRSTGRRRSTTATGRGVDVYLLPAVVGGGLGDIEEVLAAGRRLSRAGYPIYLYRRPGSSLPRNVEGPWDWPRHRRLDRLVPRARSALTITPAWGVSAAPGRAEAYGRPGPWTSEVESIERAYGPDHVLHVSLEEFARTLDARAETRERLREGGVPARAIPERLRAADRAGEVEAFRDAYRRFRAFDRSNVLPLFATFRRSRAFARAFPAAIQTGPLWPQQFRPGVARSSRRRPTWIWYASPASSERLAPRVLSGLARSGARVALFVRSPRPWSTVPVAPDFELRVGALPPGAWRRRFARADLRIVTGSRTLLEALELGGPFLYFNGVLGRGARTRRHRPEKIDALLAVGRSAGAPRAWLDDLARFARGQDIEGVVRRSVARTRGWGTLRAAALRRAFPPPFDDAGAVIVAAARALDRPGSDAPEIVRELRRRAKP